MVLSPRNKLIIAVAAAGLLSACADYSNRWDTSSARSGNAMNHNTGVHTISPWPPHVENTDVQSGD